VARGSRRPPIPGWAPVSAASGPLGGGLIKLAHGSTQAATTVAIAPFVLLALLLVVFSAGFAVMLLRYVRCQQDRVDMERMTLLWAGVLVSILTQRLPKSLAPRQAASQVDSIPFARGEDRPPGPDKAA
jgi:hypothetical protein